MNEPDPKEPNRALIAVGEWMGLAFLLPCTIFIGYLIGTQLDRWLQTTYLYIVFTLFGIAAGLIHIIRKFTKENR